MRSRPVSKQKPVQAKAQNQKAPGGAQRCRVLASRICLQHLASRGFGVLVGLLGGILVAELVGCRQEIDARVKARPVSRRFPDRDQAVPTAFGTSAETLSGERGCSNRAIVSKLQAMPMRAMRIASDIIHPDPSSGLAVNKAKEL